MLLTWPASRSREEPVDRGDRDGLVVELGQRRAWELAKAYTPAHCGRVHACDIPMLRIDSDPATVDPIRAFCRHALAHDKSRSIVLGCAAMARFAEPLSVELGVPVIDGVAAATALAEAAPRHGVMNSAAL